MGSANINDRSQRGDRDSEICLVVEDMDMIESTMNGEPYQVSRFATSLRRKLYRGLYDPSQEWRFIMLHITLPQQNTLVLWNLKSLMATLTLPDLCARHHIATQTRPMSPKMGWLLTHFLIGLSSYGMEQRRGTGRSSWSCLKLCRRILFGIGRVMMCTHILSFIPGFRWLTL